MPRARRTPLREQPLVRWLTDVDGIVRFQTSVLDHLAAYTERVGHLTEVRSIDPGEWVQDYAGFVQQVVADFGDWVRGRDPLGRDAQSVPVCSGIMRHSEGTTAVPIEVPIAAFDGLPGRDPQLTLETDGLFPRGGGTQLVRSHVEFQPRKVSRSNRRSKIVVFDVRDAVRKGAVYAGVVWAEETKLPVATVRVVVE